MKPKEHINEKGPFDIIGDIHGCYDELISLLKKLDYVEKNNLYIHKEGRKLIFLGDLSDRGPKNLKTINLIMNLVEKNLALYVHGNHCNKFYRYLLGRNVQISNGLENTIEEYENLSKTEKDIFRNKYINFYESQSDYWILDKGNLIVVHAGIKESLIGRYDKRVEKFCLYGDITGEKDEKGYPIRKDWAKNYTGKAMIVYGHTPVLEAKWINNTIDIDLGCVFGGKLACLRYPEKEIITVNSNQPKNEEKLKIMEEK
ncbi:metallophosphoesterase [Defluviitalea phaphyphila]|uniref:metallophosphoesterase n=1 Tax=Defluviitalea phaphyphila TaxID=1473580 RepID=UPI0007309683|nr:metallophosphoesterase [Defluviitalea phaphyphila]